MLLIEFCIIQEDKIMKRLNMVLLLIVCYTAHYYKMLCTFYSRKLVFSCNEGANFLEWRIPAGRPKLSCLRRRSGT